MYRTFRIIAILAAALLFVNPATVRAQRTSFGVFNSLKGFGFQLDTEHFDKGYFHTYSVFVDIYGIPTSRSKAPGVKFNYSRNYILNTYDVDNAHLSLFVGPGCTLGFVKDYEQSYFRDSTIPLVKNHGALAALSGTFGCRFDFGRRILIDVSVTLDAGLHIRRDEDLKNIDVTLYKNGIFQAPYPQVTIMTVF